jgi:hypothetical protein
MLLVSWRARDRKLCQQQLGDADIDPERPPHGRAAVLRLSIVVPPVAPSRTRQLPCHRRKNLSTIPCSSISCIAIARFDIKRAGLSLIVIVGLVRHIVARQPQLPPSGLTRERRGPTKRTTPEVTRCCRPNGPRCRGQ